MSWGEDREFREKLSGDEQAFFDEFTKEAEGSADSIWGKERRKSARADIYNRGTLLSMDYMENQSYGGWEDRLIEAIDADRRVSPKNDIAPGIIKDGRFYRCSKYTPEQTLTAIFLTEEAALEWMDKVTKAYNKVCR